MERKKFNRGTIGGGIIRIIISIVAIIIAIVVFTSSIKSWDPENIAGGIFMCVIALIMLIAGIGFIINGLKMVKDGQKSLEVLKKGHPEDGRILDLTETEVTENNNGAVSHYTIYNLKFEYNDDNGNLCESEEQISEKAYIALKQRTLCPIIVYGERAIFDRKQLEKDNTL